MLLPLLLLLKSHSRTRESGDRSAALGKTRTWVSPPEVVQREQAEAHAQAHRLARVELGVRRPLGVVDVRVVEVGPVAGRRGENADEAEEQAAGAEIRAGSGGHCGCGEDGGSLGGLGTRDGVPAAVLYVSRLPGRGVESRATVSEDSGDLAEAG